MEWHRSVNLPNASLGQNVYQNDIVNIVGRVAGATTYQTQAGGSNTVPVIDVSSISVSSGASTGVSGVSGVAGTTGTATVSGASG